MKGRHRAYLISDWCLSLLTPPPPKFLKPSLSSACRLVTHDIPVDVIPRRLWQDFKEPSVPDFDVSHMVVPYWIVFEDVGGVSF